MLVELFYFDGCPSWTVADRRLSEAMARVGRGDITVQLRKVETSAQAELIGFGGSPTIRIDGRDPFSRSGDQVGLACRIYQTPAGFGGSPTVEQLMEVLA